MEEDKFKKIYFEGSGTRGSHGCTNCGYILSEKGIEYDKVKNKYFIVGFVIKEWGCRHCEIADYTMTNKEIENMKTKDHSRLYGFYNPGYYGHDGIQF